MRSSRLCSLILVLLVGALAVAQETHDDASTPPSAHPPVANPARPTVSNPATLTPVGYVQFETGILAAWQSPDLVSQTSINEVIKYTASRWLEVEVATEPYAHSHAEGQPTNAPGDVDLGFQAVVHQGEGANPTVALSYFGRVYSGAAPDLDIASFSNSAFLLVSADVKGFHYDTNYIFNEVVDGNVRRAASSFIWAERSYALRNPFRARRNSQRSPECSTQPRRMRPSENANGGSLSFRCPFRCVLRKRDRGTP